MPVTAHRNVRGDCKVEPFAYLDRVPVQFLQIFGISDLWFSGTAHYNRFKVFRAHYRAESRRRSRLVRAENHGTPDPIFTGLPGSKKFYPLTVNLLKRVTCLVRPGAP